MGGESASPVQKRSNPGRSGVLLVLALGLAGAARAADDPAQLVRRALVANPELEAIGHRIAGLRHQARAVQRWADPIFAVEYGNFPWDSWSLGDSPMTAVQLRLQQTFPLAGKNERRRATVQGRAAALDHSLAAERNRLAAELRRGYWSLALVRQLRRLTDEHVELVGELIASVRARYQVGKAGQHDLMRLEVLQARLRDEREDFARRERALSAEINAVLHRGPTTAVETPAEFDAAAPPRRPLDDWISAAAAGNPRLAMLAARARAERLAADEAGYERWPDITVWAAYRIRRPAGVDDGSDQMTLGLSLPLPFDYTGRAAEQRAAHRSTAAATTARRSAELDRIRARIQTALADWERAAAKARTYGQGLIPDSRRTLESTQAAYQSDRADFASLYQAELQLLEFERARLAAVAQTRIQQATLDQLTGRAAPTDEE